MSEPTSSEIMYELGVIKTTVLNTHSLIEDHIANDKVTHKDFNDRMTKVEHNQTKGKAWAAAIGGTISAIVTLMLGIAQAYGPK